MKQRLCGSYFVIVKLMGLMAFLGSILVSAQESIWIKCVHFLLIALFIFLTVLMEITENRKMEFAFLIGEGILASVGVFLFPVTGVLLFTICFLDIVSALQVRVAAYFFVYLILLIEWNTGMNLLQVFCMQTFLLLFYIQEKVVLRKYRDIIDENEEAEGRLKTSIERTDRRHKEEIHKSHLQYENQMLEERGRITQALHDKLGHSINGSLYKLEAAKLLIEKKPEECRETLQDVIDNLRGSMDEIRMILRQERPDKKKMAFLSLQSFCEECEENYHIHTKLVLEKGSEAIPENIWDVILDNTFEAVTNAMKYADCENILIEILPMNEVVRCTIKDDGNGAETVEEGMGISGMKKRVRSVRGFFDIDTEPGIGFTINMVLPLK